MKLSIICQFGLKTPTHAPKIGVLGVFHGPKMGSNINETPPKGTSADRNGSSGVLIMSVSSTAPEKSRGNKKCDEEQLEVEEELRHIFGRFGIAVKWPRHGCVQLFLYLYVHSVEDSTLMSIFDQFRFSFVFLGLPKIGPNLYT